MDYFKTKVLSNQKISSDILVINVPNNDQNILPGQFFMLKSWDDHFPLFRPISVYNVENDFISFMYRVVGSGTANLAKLKKGNPIEILGPLGNGFPVNQVNGTIALVGGGVGIPPLFETAKQLKRMGNIVHVFLGYKDELFGFEEFENIADAIFIACENGNEGYKGYITDIFDPAIYNAVFTCGPEVMMFKVRDKCMQLNIPSWLSMEKHMACGVGACLVCNCDTIHGTKRACKDGPVFLGSDIL